MNNLTKTLDGLLEEPVQKPLMRDGIWAVMGWKDLQNNPIEKEPNVLLWMAVAVMLSFMVPVLAWSAAYAEEAKAGFDIPVLKHQLQRGSVITAADLEMRALTHAPAPQVLTDVTDVVGKEVFRGMRAGMPIFDSHVRVPPTVRKNGLVPMVFKSSGIEIKSVGKVLEDAMAGKRIRIMNPDSGQVLAGIVLADGTVEIQ